MPARILFVEDHPVVLEALRAKFARAGWEVAGEAGTFAEGRRLLREVAAEVALVDWNLPGGSGIRLVAAARAWQPGLQCIVYTAMPSPAIVDDAVAAGAVGVLCKTMPVESVVVVAEAARTMPGAWHMDEPTARAMREERWSEVERAVLREWATGASPSEIARRVHRSAARVRRILNFFANGLGLKSPAQIIEAARRQGVVDEADVLKLARESWPGGQRRNQAVG